MKYLVFGSLNIDRTYSVPHFVQAGETMSATKMELFCGGKGFNQAVALARAGKEVYFAGAVGNDGGMLLDALGIQLPISLDAQVFLFYGIYLALEFAISFFFAPLVQTTYAHFYEDLRKNPPQPKYVFAAPPMPPQQETTDN